MAKFSFLLPPTEASYGLKARNVRAAFCSSTFSLLPFALIFQAYNMLFAIMIFPAKNQPCHQHKELIHSISSVTFLQRVEDCLTVSWHYENTHLSGGKSRKYELEVCKWSVLSTHRLCRILLCKKISKNCKVSSVNHLPLWWFWLFSLLQEKKKKRTLLEIADILRWNVELVHCSSVTVMSYRCLKQSWRMVHVLKATSPAFVKKENGWGVGANGEEGT